MLFETLTGYNLPRIARKRAALSLWGVRKTKNFVRVDFGKNVWYLSKRRVAPFHTLTKIIDNQGHERVERYIRS